MYIHYFPELMFLFFKYRLSIRLNRGRGGQIMLVVLSKHLPLPVLVLCYFCSCLMKTAPNCKQFWSLLVWMQCIMGNILIMLMGAIDLYLFEICYWPIKLFVYPLFVSKCIWVMSLFGLKWIGLMMSLTKVEMVWCC